MSLIKKSAVEMAAALEKKEITSVELTQEHLNRISEVDRKVKAFLHKIGRAHV